MNPHALPGEAIEPLFFGPQENLFGVYHIPPAGTHRNTVIVLCPPIEQEAIRSHRAYRQLAVQLCKLGFPVFRFDYTGTGDSHGDGTPPRLTQWVEDIQAAITQAKQSSRKIQVALVGLRIGATLAAQINETLPLEALVMWEPVAHGEVYLDQLRHWHEDKLRYSLSAIQQAHESTPDELLGMALPPQFYQDVASLNMNKINLCAGQTLLLTVEHGLEYPSIGPWPDCLQRLTQILVDDPKVWFDDPDKALVPHHAIDEICNWFAEKLL